MPLDVRKFVQDARDFYDSKGKPPIVLPLGERASNPETVRLSQLTSCELQHALSKAKFEHTNPETMNYHLFDVGEAVAEIFQKSMLFYAQSSLDYAVEVEGNVEVEAIQGLGRYDALVTYREVNPLGETETHQMIIELKNTEGFIKRSVGEPKDSYAFQCLAYIMATGIPHASIITASKWQWQVWYLKPVDYSDLEKGYQLFDEWGNLYEPKWGDNWNTPENLNFATAKQRSDVMLEYMGYVNLWLTNKEHYPHPRMIRPIDNPLDTERNIWCTRIADKGKKTDRGGTPPRPKTVHPNCEYFSFCWNKANINDSGVVEVIEVDGTEYLDGYDPEPVIE